MKPGQVVGRKAPCPCGSGKKYKSCCYALDRAKAEAPAPEAPKPRRSRKPKATVEEAAQSDQVMKETDAAFSISEAQV